MGIDDIYSFCFTELNLTYVQARSMTLWEYALRSKGFDRQQEREWHKIRVLASMLLQPHLRKGKKIQPQDLIKLPSDQSNKVMHTRQDFERFMEKINAK